MPRQPTPLSVPIRSSLPSPTSGTTRWPTRMSKSTGRSGTGCGPVRCRWRGGSTCLACWTLRRGWLRSGGARIAPRLSTLTPPRSAPWWRCGELLGRSQLAGPGPGSGPLIGAFEFTEWHDLAEAWRVAKERPQVLAPASLARMVAEAGETRLQQELAEGALEAQLRLLGIKPTYSEVSVADLQIRDPGRRRPRRSLCGCRGIRVLHLPREPLPYQRNQGDRRRCGPHIRP